MEPPPPLTFLLWRDLVDAVRAIVIGFGIGVVPACTSVLGIDEAHLEVSAEGGADDRSGVAASTDGTVDASLGDEPSCANLAKGPCETCLAAHCCADYSSCLVAPACMGELASYNQCVARNLEGGGTTCSEALATSSDPAARALAACVFVSSTGRVQGCAAVCDATAITSQACWDYCDCMKSTCASYLDPMSCPAACSTLTDAQRTCRTQHCGYARTGSPETHCQHAVGAPDLGICL